MKTQNKTEMMIGQMNDLYKEMLADESIVYCSDCGKRYNLAHICKEPPHNWTGDCEECEENLRMEALKSKTQTQNQTCKCGHDEKEHYYYICKYHNEQDENGEVEYCPCKK